MTHFGSLGFASIPTTVAGAGIITPFGVILPPGGRVAAYVRATASDSDAPEIAKRRVTTVNQALLQCKSGATDVVVVLPGHTESISAADAWSNLVAGTRIIGLGSGTSRPTFTWTATASTVLLDVANVEISNCIMYMAGNPASTTALTVTAPMTVSAAGCGLFGCYIQTAVDADQLATIAITTTAAGDDFKINNCFLTSGTSDGTGVTTAVRLVGADRFQMHDTVVYGATSSTTVGPVQFLTTASLDVDIARCVFQNRKASSVNSFTGMTGVTGTLRDCDFAVLDNATLAGANTTGSLQMFGNRVCNVAAENAGIGTPVSA